MHNSANNAFLFWMPLLQIRDVKIHTLWLALVYTSPILHHGLVYQNTNPRKRLPKQTIQNCSGLTLIVLAASSPSFSFCILLDIEFFLAFPFNGSKLENKDVKYCLKSWIQISDCIMLAQASFYHNMRKPNDLICY